MTRLAAAAVLILTWVAVGVGYAAGDRAIPTAVGCGLAVCAIWAVPGYLTWRSKPAPLVAVGTLLAASGLAASRFEPDGGKVATVLAAITAAVVLHWLLAAPVNHLTRGPRTAGAIAGYAAAGAAAAWLVAAGHPLTSDTAGLAAVAIPVVAFPSLRESYRRARSADRDWMRWLAAGALVGACVVVIALTLHVIVKWPQALLPAVALAAAAPAVGLAASESRRLAGAAGRVLVEVVSVVGFSLVISAIYLVVVFGLGQTPESNADREALALSMVAAGVVAASFGPARRRLTTWAQRAVFGARQAPDDLIGAFGNRLTRAMPMDELLLQLAESLVRSLDLTRADIYTGTGDVLERTAGVPDTGSPHAIVISERERPAVVQASVSGNAWIDVWLPGLTPLANDSQLRVAPIRNAGELLGLLVVERGVTAEPFSEDDERVLADLARQVGLALHNVNLDAALQDTLAELRTQAAELRESRARIVASGDAERRRVERDLHDGAQQSLVALAIGLRLARDVLDSDPRATARMLDEINHEVQNIIAELRELAHGIYPPLLANGGLALALDAAATRSPLAVKVEVETSSRFAQAVEAAVYFCCLESLQNAAKHAPGASVKIRVWCEAATLFFQVCDDGPGFDPDSTARGHGLINMTDRVGAIGGRVRWRSQPGQGVEVAGSVPLATESMRR